MNVLTNESLAAAIVRAAKRETPREITLHEYPHGERTIVDRPTEVWALWATGQVWWNPVNEPVPHWAAALRGQWDPDWSTSC